MEFISWIIQIVFGLLGLSKKPQASAEAQAAGHAASAETDLSNSEKTVAELQAAAAARAAADAQRVRNDPHAGDVVTDPSAPINNLPGEHFRD